MHLLLAEVADAACQVHVLAIPHACCVPVHNGSNIHPGGTESAGSLAYVLVVESLIDAVWPEGTQWGPAHVFGYFTSTSVPMSYGAALGVALLWMLGFVVVSGVTFHLMDISASSFPLVRASRTASARNSGG